MKRNMSDSRYSHLYYSNSLSKNTGNYNSRANPHKSRQVVGGTVFFGTDDSEDAPARITLPPKDPEKIVIDTDDGKDDDGKDDDGNIDVRTKYPNHVFLALMDTPPCKTLTGDVLFCFVFVNHPSKMLFWNTKKYRWNDGQKKILDQSCNDAIQRLETEASKDDVTLKCLTEVFEIDAAAPKRTNDISESSKTTNTWRDELAKNQNCASIEELMESLRKKHNVQQVAFLFLTKLPGRSFAQTQYRRSKHCEYAIIFKETSNQMGTIIHETLHLFGAEDLYFNHPVIRPMTEKLFPNSIMYHSNDNAEITNLARYTIGWHEYPKEDALEFLEATKNITQDEYDEWRRKS